MQTWRWAFSRYALAGLLVLAAAGCKKPQDEAPEAAVVVQAAHPTRGMIAEEIAADAILAPLSQAAIAPRISAPIRTEYVQRGAHVRRGQLLVTLEDGDLRGSALDSAGAVTAAKASARAAADATVPEEQRRAELEVAQLQAARDVADRTATERKRLFEQGALSGRDADTAYAAAVQAEAALATAERHLESVVTTTGATTKESAQGQLDSAQGRLISAQAQESYARLRSPIDGMVTDRPLFPGETSIAGSPLITVMDTSSLLAKLHLSQAAAQKLEPGRRAEIRFAGVDEPVTAKVTFISPALDPGSATVEVWLAVANLEGRYKVGTPVHAVIRGSAAAQALLIPTAAVLPSQDGGTSVLVVGADGVAHTRAIKIGIRTAEAVQVVSGLSTSDMVVTGGGYGLDDNTKVTIGKPAAGGETE